MPLIRHHDDPAAVTGSTFHEIPDGTNLLDWLIDNYGEAHQIADGLPIDIILNGHVLVAWDGSEPVDQSIVDIDLSLNDEVVIVARPGEAATIIQIVVAIVAAVVAVALAPTVPGDAGQGKSSPNNSLQAANNSFRPGEGIPEIFGNLISYPDFIQPSAFEYVNNLRIVSELFCIGVGQYDVTDVKTETTLINDIEGSSFIVYNPGDVVPAEQLVIHTGTNEVDGQVLKAPNDESIRQTGQIDSVAANGTDNTTITLVTDSTVVLDFELQPGDYLRVFARSASPQVTLLQGFYQVVSVSATNPAVIELDTTDGITGDVGPSDSDSVLTLVDDQDEEERWLGWFNIPGDDAEEILFHWQMPQGIRFADGGTFTLNLEFEIEILNSDGTPSGVVFQQNLSKSGSTLDPQFVTTRFTPSNFPGMTRSQYRGRMRRNTNQLPAGGSDQVKVEDFVSVTPYTNPNFGNVTLVFVQRRATTFAVSQQQSKINANVTRRLPVYNRTTGQYDVNNLQATRDFADAVAYMIIVAGNRQASTVDLEELYGVNDGLPYPELGRFDFTFDDFDVSLGERVASACNVARVAAFRDGAVWRFVRDEVKPFRRAMFNRRVFLDRESTQGFQMIRPDDKDSVALTYIDPEDNVERVLYRALNYDTGEITSGQPGNQALEINLAGCRNFYQASNRADLEIRRIAFQRRSVNDTVTRDGLLVGIMQRVGWVDPNDMELFDGDILGIDGDRYETSERFIPAPGATYFVYVTDDEGNPSNAVTCTPRDDTEFGFVAAGLSGAYLPAGTTQGASRYFIGTDEDMAASDFLISKRSPNSDGSVQLEMVEYVPRIYERDVVPPQQPAPTLPSAIDAVDHVTEPAASTVELTFNPDGTFTAGSQSGTWLPNTPVTNGDLYEIRFTLESGDNPTGELDEWLQLNMARTLSLSQDVEGTSLAVITIEIRQRFYEDQVTVGSATMSAIVSDTVSLPSTLSVTSISIGGLASAEIRLQPNGAWQEGGVGAINPQSGSYTTPGTGVGSQFEAMATINSGTVNFGSFGVWLPISVSRAWGNFVTSGQATGEINLEIREIDNPTNTTTSTVTLSAETEL